ncbi:hypothetical protein BJ973_003220 [Actinoplanes tereljensis]|uniref:eCIS core domain-containing protein n=1 Tax=Paractinoplanes tereljensis TaxID=571912 RepID=UPI0019427BA2|nr:DUF4157 domain-containing protein [Actinoplanes tereljensis]
MSNPESAAGLRVLGAATAPPGSVPDPSGAFTASPAAGHRMGGGDVADLVRKSPRERWEAAVAARPLEAPRALPGALHAMASALTGRARPPLFTTGPNTRHALAAAGALGATTGTVVHLPAAPPSGPAVSAVLAHELMHTRSPVRRPRFLLDGVSGLLDDDERQALSAGKQAAATGAGIVDSLPVGGGLGAVSEVATRAARAAVIEATASPVGSAFSGLSGDAFSGLQGAAGDAFSGLQGAAGSAASGMQEAASGAASTVSAAASDVVGGAASAVGQAAGAAKAGLDADQVVEIVERRLLREIERRGGRWAGLF